jgi:phage protein D
MKGEHSAKINDGDPMTITCKGIKLFDGEVTGLEPVYDHNLPSRITIRALNKMHRLTRGRKSRTFEQQTDQQIVQTLAGEAGLSAECDSDPTIVYDHVYQHNQTNLEVIRQRAARINFEIRVVGSTLYFKKRGQDDGAASLEWGGGKPGSIERFRPRISGANQVGKVICRGWNPITKKEIIGTATSGPEYGGTLGAGLMGNVVSYQTDRPIFTKDEADAAAKGMLREHQMRYITGEALTLGNPSLKARMRVTIDVNDPKFNGDYYVFTARHRYIHSVGGADGVAHREAGYRTMLRVHKDAEK